MDRKIMHNAIKMQVLRRETVHSLFIFRRLQVLFNDAVSNSDYVEYFEDAE
jgi:hypothetical protein